MEVGAGHVHIASLGPYGSDETGTPKEEDCVEDHDDQQGPNSEDEKCHSITDVTLLITVDRA
jgi:hypothetical protein